MPGASTQLTSHSKGSSTGVLTASATSTASSADPQQGHSQNTETDTRLTENNDKEERRIAPTVTMPDHSEDFISLDCGSSDSDADRGGRSSSSRSSNSTSKRKVSPSKYSNNSVFKSPSNPRKTPTLHKSPPSPSSPSIPIHIIPSSSNGASPSRMSSRNLEKFSRYVPISPLMAEEKERKRREWSEEEEEQDEVTVNDECPWARQGGYETNVRGLHYEIKDFVRFISPTPEEKNMRDRVVERIKKVIQSFWPHAKVEVFGSYRTGLYLPTSDVDLVVFGRWPHLPLRTLERAFINEGIADEDGIQVIDKAAVPIVKVIDSETEVRCDISFNMANSMNAVDLVKRYLLKFPNLRPLVFVLKQFLNQRDLNEVYFGGLSSYSLVLMAISFIQLHPGNYVRNPHGNLGVLLLEFLELYGFHFNYNHVAIRIKDGGAYIQKSEFYRTEVKQRCPDRGLSIEDPYTKGNDISRGSYHCDKVVAAFEKAFFVLQHAVLPKLRKGQQGGFDTKKWTRSLLVHVIQLSPELVAYRQWIKDNYKEESSSKDSDIDN